MNETTNKPQMYTHGGGKPHAITRTWDNYGSAVCDFCDGFVAYHVPAGVREDLIKANLDAAERYRKLGNYKDSRIALEQAQALGADVSVSLRMTREAEVEAARDPLKCVRCGREETFPDAETESESGWEQAPAPEGQHGDFGSLCPDCATTT